MFGTNPNRPFMFRRACKLLSCRSCPLMSTLGQKSELKFKIATRNTKVPDETIKALWLENETRKKSPNQLIPWILNSDAKAELMQGIFSSSIYLPETF